ncbi:alpha/beta fold hydrolase [Methylomagnum ishizawai]|uniref:alpha/beta fold hydrolase n=1 Tax=Methylomagnum ishizawai TaxID=1760988 RepID=UPI001C7F2926|nr:alpha/beta hydrolase [Methylomagnum ishizawai]
MTQVRPVWVARKLRWRWVRAWTLSALCAVLAGCASPAGRVYAMAAAAGFQALSLEGGGFRLAAFYKPAAVPNPVLHVYLEGDGTPWESRWRIAQDPTPRHPLMLRLMALDPAPALYLGRPCYHGHAQDAGCSPALWTDRRYGPEVVEALAAGLRGFVRARGFRRLRLFGHSGGGALAVLLAPRLPGTLALVTVAGNLDSAAWTAYHGYSPLAGSLNPADLAPVVAEYHYLGADDPVIPPQVFAPIARNRSPGNWVILPKMGHGCCWEAEWGLILKRLEPGPALPHHE